MTYQHDKNQQYLNRLQNQITDFVSHYNANPNTEHTTVCLFPGGLASKLMRAQNAWPNPPSSYDCAWIDCSILTGSFYNLVLSANEEDYQDKFIIPDQSIDWMELTPYDQFIKWCQGGWLDLFIFGWDWRMPTAQAADFFLNSFMPLFEQRTGNECVSNPLSNFWLLGHSFGGLVVKQIINNYTNRYVQILKGAITAGTSFYGYGGQVHRFFVGDSDLNGTEGVQGARIVTEIISTLPAGYELMFLDGDTFDLNQAGFANDPDGYNLTTYPSVDPQTNARVDPYHPVPGEGQNQNGYVRYISTYGFDWDMLSDGLAACKAFAQSLDASVARKFFNIRGVQGTARGAELKNTCIAQTWTLVPADLDPDNGVDGIRDILGPGDDTLPAWATRLIGNPQVQTVWAPDLDHMDLLNHQAIQIAIANILDPSVAMTRRLVNTARTVKLRAASRPDLNRLLQALGKIPSEKGEWSQQRKARVRNIILEASRGDPYRLQEFLARAYLDALRTPDQRLGGRDIPRSKH